MSRNTISIEELAKRVGKTSQTVRNYIKEGKLVPDAVHGIHVYFYEDKVNYYANIITGNQDSIAVLRFVDSDGNKVSDEAVAAYMTEAGFLFDSDNIYDERIAFLDKKLEDYLASDEFKEALRKDLQREMKKERERLEQVIKNQEENCKFACQTDKEFVAAMASINNLTVDNLTDEMRKACKVPLSIPADEAYKLVRAKLLERAENINKKITVRCMGAVSLDIARLKNLEHIYRVDYEPDEEHEEVYIRRYTALKNRYKRNELHKNIPSKYDKVKRYSIFDVSDKNEQSFADAFRDVFRKMHSSVMIVGTPSNEIKGILTAMDESGFIKVNYMIQ